MPRRRRSRLLLMLLLGLVLAASAEGVVRVRQWMKYGVAGGTFHRQVLDEASGLMIPEPGVVEGREQRITVNDRGFRGPPIDVPKPAGRRRIAFLGGSTTFCAEASDDAATWPQLVWRGLQAAFPDADVDHVNGGVGGYAVAQSRRNLAARVAPLEPDLIVIYHATNDLSAGTRELAVAAGLVTADAHEPSWLARHSLAWNLIEKNWLRGAPASDPASGDDDGDSDGDGGGGGGILEVEPALHAARFEERLAALVDEARAVAPVVVLVTFSHRARREQDPQTLRRSCESSLYYMPYLTPQAVLEGIEAYNAVIRRVAADRGVLLVEDEHGIPGDAEHFADSVHLTDAGSRLQAERILGVLREAPAVRDLLSP